MNKVTVLMSTYNGERYLEEQIKSLIKQRNVDLQIFVRDDGSKDKTKEILNKYQAEGVLHWYTGDNLRSAKSFMDLVNTAPESDYYAFCDQDDIWNEDKLERAIIEMKNYKSDNVPILYCSNYQLVDENLKNLSDNHHVTTTTFNAALVSSCCTGCTTVFNRKLLNYLRMGNPDLMVMHDDWVHKVCLAVGGKVVYDKYKSLKYRQHGANVDGGVHNLKSRISKIKERIQKKDRIRSKQIEELLDIYRPYMSADHILNAEKVAYYYKKGIMSRLFLAFGNSISTPYERLNRGFRVAIIFKYY